MSGSVSLEQAVVLLRSPAALQTFIWAAMHGDDARLERMCVVSESGRAHAEALLASLPENARGQWTAEKLGLVSLTCEESELKAKALEVARKLAAGPQTALRWTKYSLNNWLRMAGPAFDASLALEVLGFSGPEAKEGVASHREKRKPNFPPEPKDF